eukprot:scaffold92780_cov58-Phaeocystis_antarctica.AAC.2
MFVHGVGGGRGTGRVALTSLYTLVTTLTCARPPPHPSRVCSFCARGAESAVRRAAPGYAIRRCHGLCCERQCTPFSLDGTAACKNAPRPTSLVAHQFGISACDHARGGRRVRHEARPPRGARAAVRGRGRLGDAYVRRRPSAVGVGGRALRPLCAH